MTSRKSIRAARLRRAIAALDGISNHGGPPEALLVVSIENIGWEDVFYYTGFMGSSSALAVVRGEASLFVDSRYEEAAERVDCCRVVPCAGTAFRTPIAAALDMIKREGVTRLAYGGAPFAHSVYRIVTTALGDQTHTVDVSSLLAGMRRRKIADELSRIRQAVKIASRAFEAAAAEAGAGMTERAFAALLEYRLLANGADFFAPPPVITASGERASQPHAMPSDRRFRAGDTVLVDFGVRYGGYVCDISRVISVGRPTSEAASVHSILTWAQSEAVAAIRPGVHARDVDAAARAVLESAGLGDGFTHALGHGIGIAMHEPPSISRHSDAVLAEGDVVTIEPGYYRRGEFGMRVEDDYLITRDGAVPLSEELNKELIIV